MSILKKLYFHVYYRDTNLIFSIKLLKHILMDIINKPLFGKNSFYNNILHSRKVRKRYVIKYKK